MSGIQPETSDDKLWAGLGYAGLVIFWVPTIVIFLMKKGESEYVKFHSLQALLFAAVTLVINIAFTILGNIPIVGFIVGIVWIFFFLAVFGYWAFLMVMAFMGKEVEIPMLGAVIRQNWMA